MLEREVNAASVSVVRISLTCFIMVKYFERSVKWVIGWSVGLDLGLYRSCHLELPTGVGFRCCNNSF